MPKYECIRTEPYTTEDHARSEVVTMGTIFTDATFLFSEAILRTGDRRLAIRVPLSKLSSKFKVRKK